MKCLLNVLLPMNMRLQSSFCWFSPLSCLLVFAFGSAIARAQDTINVDLPDGFSIRQIAGPELADDIYSMTVSDSGQVFVAGRGYIKRLIDADGDGVFESAIQFASVPKNGAQGMLATGDILLCTGDEGLLRFQDSDRDGIADGPPELVLKIQTGVEHGSHSMRYGPDGSLYLLAGNATAIAPEFYSNEMSPIKEPRAGFLMRILPTGSKQIVAHGFRNPYDFDFNDAGEIFVYDSDGERDISLPWYRPTRVYHIRPGDDAGWVGVGWKRPRQYFDMPRTVAALGRGSPTGVEVNRQRNQQRKNTFPAEYDQAVFVADWTFGRVVALVRNEDGYRPIDFAVSQGQFGFAVTDLAFDSDGSLLVSVGGRGTRGAVYRISADMKEAGKAALPDDIRLAYQIRGEDLPVQELIHHLGSKSHQVMEAAMCSLVMHSGLGSKQQQTKQIVNRLASILNDADLATVGLAFRVAQRLPATDVMSSLEKSMSVEVKALMRLATATDFKAKKSALLETVRILPTTTQPPLMIRAAQLSLGGCTRTPADPMFAGYEPRSEISGYLLSAAEKNLLASNISAAMRRQLTFADGANMPIDANHSFSWNLHELGRLAAMIGPEFELNSNQKSPVEDVLRRHALLEGDNVLSVESTIHWLNVAARIGLPDTEANELRTQECANVLCDALFAVAAKLNMAQQPIDRNFDPRMTALVKALAKNDSVAAGIARRFEGSDDSLYCFFGLPESKRTALVPEIATNVRLRPVETTVRQLRVLADDNRGRFVSELRKFSDRMELRVPVLRGLSRDPLASDADLFVRSINQNNPEVVKFAAISLRRLIDSRQILTVDKPSLIVNSVLAARSLGWSRADVSARDQVVLLLRSLTKKDFRYVMQRYQLGGADKSLQEEAVNRWITAAKDLYPHQFAILTKPKVDPNVAKLLATKMSSLDFSTGDIDRGKAIYQKLRCAQCHDAGNRLGPRLEGLGKRFSRVDLLRSIVDPSDFVPDRYQSVAIATLDGNVIRGTIVYDSVAGLVLQTADGMTATVRKADIDERSISKTSLMPDGLLDEATDQEWIDLVKFLESK